MTRETCGCGRCAIYGCANADAQAQAIAAMVRGLKDAGHTRAEARAASALVIPSARGAFQMRVETIYPYGR